MTLNRQVKELFSNRQLTSPTGGSPVEDAKIINTVVARGGALLLKIDSWTDNSATGTDGYLKIVVESTGDQVNYFPTPLITPIAGAEGETYDLSTGATYFKMTTNDMRNNPGAIIIDKFTGIKTRVRVIASEITVQFSLWLVSDPS